MLPAKLKASAYAFPEPLFLKISAKRRGIPRSCGNWRKVLCHMTQANDFMELRSMKLVQIDSFRGSKSLAGWMDNSVLTVAQTLAKVRSGR